MPRRYLSPSVARDKLLNRVAQQNEFAALVYFMALPQAADDCTLPTTDSEELLTLVCPARRDKIPDDMAAAINLLTSERDDHGHTLLEYTPDGRLRYPPLSFYRHQTYIPEPKRTTSPPAHTTAPMRYAPASPNNAGTSEKLRPQNLDAPITAPFTVPVPVPVPVPPSLSPTVSPVPPAPCAPTPPRGGPPTRLAQSLPTLTGPPNGARELSQNGVTLDPPTITILADQQLWQRHPHIAHHVLDAEQKLSDHHSRPFLIRLALTLHDRGALDAIWTRALGLAREQQGARNRAALFVSIVRRLCQEAHIDLGDLASPRPPPTTPAAPTAAIAVAAASP